MVLLLSLAKPEAPLGTAAALAIMSALAGGRATEPWHATP